jgi:SAM-dependent methyltransferase
MPDSSVVAELYGTGYASQFYGEDVHEQATPEHTRVIDCLEHRGRGTFIDYGCGNGDLLMEARRTGWRTLGVEFDPQVARKVQERTGSAVVTVDDPAVETGAPAADALHLGDVIEHLTDLDQRLPKILSLLKPGGVLIARGPLEANPNLFTLAVRLGRLVRRRRVDMPPYHVLLATAGGQQALFRRMGLRELDFSVCEVSWPAVDSLRFSDLTQPKTVGLFALRRVSQLLSATRPNRWGNRYFYLGEKT